MKIVILALSCLLYLSQVYAQEKKYPLAKATDQPHVVISPYEATRRLDVSNLNPGTLAEDPIAKKLFRIPFPKPKQQNPAGRPVTNQGDMEEPGRSMVEESGVRNLPSPVRVENSVGNPSVIGMAPVSERGVKESELPADLLDFVISFQEKFVLNDSNALIPFYADSVDDYFGKKNASKSEIRSDRSSYIKRYPRREYTLDGTPELLGRFGNIYNVMFRVRYCVRGSSGNGAGVVSDYLKIRQTGSSYEIVSINQAKAAPTEEHLPSTSGSGSRMGARTSPPPRPTRTRSYSGSDKERVHQFLDDLVESGQINDAREMTDFMHPEIETYFTLKNPSRSQMLNDRKVYISRWPKRIYKLLDNPVINEISSGVWKSTIRTDYEIRKGSRTVRGLEVSDVEVVQTAEGFKVMAIRSRYCVPRKRR